MKWEYLDVEQIDLQGFRMRELGKDGWELIIFIPHDEMRSRDRYIFKRPININSIVRMSSGEK